MKGTMIILGTDGSVERRELTQAADLLPVLQKEVGGYIEAVPYFKTFLDGGEQRRCVALCNEEGKLNNLPYNALATALWHDLLKKTVKPSYMPMAAGGLDVLVGPVLILMGDDEFMEEL